MSAKRKKRKTLTPRTARTTKDLCAMPRDNVDCAGFWMLANTSTVTITAQRLGHASTGTVTIPKRDFDRFVDWYNTGTLHRQKKGVRK